MGSCELFTNEVVNNSTGVSMCCALDGRRGNSRENWTAEIQWPDGFEALIKAGAADREPKYPTGTGTTERSYGSMLQPNGQSIVFCILY